MYVGCSFMEAILTPMLKVRKAPVCKERKNTAREELEQIARPHPVAGKAQAADSHMKMRARQRLSIFGTPWLTDKH